MSLVDNAVYADGKRVADPAGLDQTLEAMKEHDGIGWIGLLHPTPDELALLATELGVHELALEDASKGHQRSKLEYYGDGFSVVARSARYIDETETVEFGEIHLLAGTDFVVSVRQAPDADLTGVRRRLESRPDLLAMGPMAVVYGVLDSIVDGYAPVVAGLETDIDEIEDQIFAQQDSGSLSQRIYELHREVIGFQRAVRPLEGILEDLRRRTTESGADVELDRLLRDVQDHVLRVDERVSGFRDLLDTALSTHSTLVSLRQTDAAYEQNEQVKRISAWAAIVFAPTLVSGIYGMNFVNMPELEWHYGYPMAWAMMAGVAGGLYGAFKRKGWL